MQFIQDPAHRAVLALGLLCGLCSLAFLRMIFHITPDVYKQDYSLKASNAKGRYLL